MSACGLGEFERPGAEGEVLADQALDGRIEGQAVGRTFILAVARDRERPEEGDPGERQVRRRGDPFL